MTCSLALPSVVGPADEHCAVLSLLPPVLLSLMPISLSLLSFECSHECPSMEMSRAASRPNLPIQPWNGWIHPSPTSYALRLASPRCPRHAKIQRHHACSSPDRGGGRAPTRTACSLATSSCGPRQRRPASPNASLVPGCDVPRPSSPQPAQHGRSTDLASNPLVLKPFWSVRIRSTTSHSSTSQIRSSSKRDLRCYLTMWTARMKTSRRGSRGKC